MKNSNINPMGLKGNEINERMKELMGIKTINENTSKIAIELTKVGPDGKSYAIVRENHEYYIKTSNKTTNLIAEDFKYIGGLQNKKSEAYPSYAKAIKHLNLNFKSLAEAYGNGGDINVFVDDNLLSENAIAGGFSSHSGNGFSGAGNLEGNSNLHEEEVEEIEESIEDIEDEDDDLSESEKAIDAMIEEDKLVGDQDKLDADKDGDIEGDDLSDLRAGKVNETLSIELAIDSMDYIIDSLKKKVQ
jgi:hypothetical protein